MHSRLSFTGAGALLVALLASFLVLAPPAQADENAPQDPVGCAANLLADGDDAFVSADLGFAIDTGDVDVDGVPIPVSDVFVSENGIVSFGSPIEYWYNGFDLRDVTNFFGDAELIAPLFADAVRGATGSVNYGQVNYLGRSAFCVQWNDLEPYVPEGFYNPADIPSPLPTNNFELIIVERADRASGDFDIVINYESIQWDDVHCQEGFFGEFEGEAQLAARAPGQFNGCCSDFEIDEGCFGELGFRADVERVDAPIVGFAALEAVEDSVFPFANVGALAGISFSTGFSAEGVIEFPGSGDILQMVDAEGLAARSLNSLQAGRFVIEVEGGFNNSDLGSIVGLVSREDTGAPVGGAIVETCITSTDMEVPLVNCQSTLTDAGGNYEVGGTPEGDYRITAFGPSGSSLFPSSVTVNVDFTFAATTAPEIVLSGPEELPPGLDFGPTSSWGQGITVYWGEDLDINLTGCVGGTGIWVITAEDGPDAGGDLTENGGTYTGVVPALNPTHGQGELTITIVCPDPADNQDIGVGLYIDPSGEIFEIHSGELVEGATATLFRSAGGELGPFEAVPDGSAIMSPSNRTNPFVVDASGRFGWDVIEGYYVVEATKADCDVIPFVDDATPASSTAVLEVQPEWLGLQLYLDCNNEPTIEAGVAVTLEAPASVADLAPPASADLDPTDVLTVTADLTGPLPLGVTTVTWTVTDPDGASASTTQAVTVQDTVAPTIQVSEDLVAEATSPAGAAVAYDAPVASDAVDAGLVARCTTASGSTFPLGATTVGCFASDLSGNEGLGQFVVTVQDTIAPVVGVSDDLIVEATSPEGAPVEYDDPVVTDAASPDAVARCTNASGFVFPFGATTVRCFARDLSGNEGDAEFMVTVQDTTAPVIEVSADLVVEATSADGAVVEFVAPVVTDAGAPDARARCTTASGSVFPIGQTIVDCFASDSSGNEGVAGFSVTVQDTTIPTLAIPLSLAGTSADGQPITLDFSASAIDSVDGPIVPVCTPASGSLFPVGETTVSCVATDNAGNATPGSFVVTVEGPVVPIGDIRGSINEIADQLDDIDGLSYWDGYRVRLAVAYLNYADRDSHWADDNRLTNNKGRTTLWALRVAVSKLSRVHNDDVDALNLELVQQMRELAVVELGDAVDAGGNQNRIDRAELYIDRGDSRVDRGWLSSAAYYFSRAWSSADSAF